MSNKVHVYKQCQTCLLRRFQTGFKTAAGAGVLRCTEVAALDKWGKTFLGNGKFVLGDKLSIADFKVETLTLRLYSHTPCDYLCS